MKKLVFITYGGGHAAMMIPVIKWFLEDSFYNVVVIGLTTSKQVLEKEGVECLGFYDLAKVVCTRDYKEIGKSLIETEPSSGSVSYSESEAYHGINYLDLVEQYGEAEAFLQYEKYGRQCFLPINFMTSILEYLHPDLLIATNSPRSERAAVEAARKLGIKSLCLVDMFALQEIKWVGQPGYADKICVLNSSVKKLFVDYGRLESEVVVTGNPAFDSLFDREIVESSKGLRELKGIDCSKKLILYASQPEPEIHPFNDRKGDPQLPREIERELRLFVSLNPEYSLIVRYHPSENVAFDPQYNVFQSAKHESLHELLHAVDIVVVTASTVGLEASLIGKQVVSVDASIFTEDAPFSKMGISVGVKEVSKLRGQLLTLDSSGNRSQAGDSFSTLASKNIISEIEKMIS